MLKLAVFLLLALGCLTGFSSADGGTYIVGDEATQAAYSIKPDGSQAQVVSSIHPGSVVSCSALHLAVAAKIDVAGLIIGFVAFNVDGSSQTLINIPAGFSCSGLMTCYGSHLFFYDNIIHAIVQVDLSVSLTLPTFHIVGSLSGGLVVGNLLGGTVCAISATDVDIYINTETCIFKMKIATGVVSFVSNIVGSLPGVNAVLCGPNIVVGLGAKLLGIKLGVGISLNVGGGLIGGLLEALLGGKKGPGLLGGLLGRELDQAQRDGLLGGLLGGGSGGGLLGGLLGGGSGGGLLGGLLGGGTSGGLLGGLLGHNGLLGNLGGLLGLGLGVSAAVSLNIPGIINFVACLDVQTVLCITSTHDILAVNVNTGVSVSILDHLLPGLITIPASVCLVI